MYSHLVKGFSVGHLLTRRVLRTITSIPGVAIDAIVAMFWAPNYRDYWYNFNSYADGTRVGPIEGVFGWIGEATGMVVGALVGSVIGLAVYGVDSLFSLVRLVQQSLYDGLDGLNQFLVGISPSFSFPIENSPNYLIKAFNLGSFILGGLIAACPWLIAKTLEFCVPPMEDYLSRGVQYTSGWLGGSAMFLVSIPLYPAVYLFKRGVELYSSLRETMRFSVAVVYGKTGTEPALDAGNVLECQCPEHTLHSDEFRADVRYVSQSSWSVLLRNGFHRSAPAAPVNVQVVHQPPPVAAVHQAQVELPPPAYNGV